MTNHDHIPNDSSSSNAGRYMSHEEFDELAKSAKDKAFQATGVRPLTDEDLESYEDEDSDSTGVIPAEEVTALVEIGRQMILASGETPITEEEIAEYITQRAQNALSRQAIERFKNEGNPSPAAEE